MFDLFNTAKVRALEAEVHRLELELASTKSTAETHRTQYNEEATKAAHLALERGVLARKRDALEERVVDLEVDLKTAFRVPELPIKPGEGALVDPLTMTPDQGRGVTAEMISDDSYLAFDEATLVQLLAPIQAKVKSLIG